MCKKVKKIAATLVLVFALTGLLTVSAFAEDNYQGRVVAEITLPGYTTYELHENEVIRIPLVYTDTTITPFGTGYLTGNAGYVQVTDTPGNIHWSVYVNRPADRFKGWVGVTDCTTGLSCGTESVSKFYGDYTITKGHKNHWMRFSINGTAYLGTKAVAKTSGQSYYFTAR